MWPVASLADLNARARVGEFASDLVVFATDGAGEGFALQRQTGAFVNLPMIGMRIVDRTPAGGSFDTFLRWLASRVPAEGPPPQPNRERLGLVLHETTPIIVGGSPTDPANKVLVPLEQYADLVGWWNERLLSRDALPEPGSGMPANDR